MNTSLHLRTVTESDLSSAFRAHPPHHHPPAASRNTSQRAPEYGAPGARHSIPASAWESYAYVTRIDMIIDLRTWAPLPVSGFYRRFQELLPGRADREDAVFGATSPLKKVDDFIFAPGEPLIVQRESRTFLNRCCRPCYQPEAGDTGPFCELLNHVFESREEVVSRFLDCLAYLAQNPGRTLRYAPTIVAPRPIGKTLLLTFVGELLSPENTFHQDIAVLSQQHNDWMLRAEIVVMDELGRMSASMAGRFRQMITGSQIMINPKGDNQFQIPNTIRFFASARRRGEIKLDSQDTHLWIIPSDAPALHHVKAAEVRQWFDEEGKAATLYLLLQRDVSHFSPYEPPPRHEAQEDIVRLSLTAVEAFLRESLDAGSKPLDTDLVSVTDLARYLTRVERIPATVPQVSSALDSLGALKLGQKRLLDNTKPQIRAVRNQEFWRLQGEKAIAEYYRPCSG